MPLTPAQRDQLRESVLSLLAYRSNRRLNGETCPEYESIRIQEEESRQENEVSQVVRVSVAGHSLVRIALASVLDWGARGDCSMSPLCPSRFYVDTAHEKDFVKHTIEQIVNGTGCFRQSLPSTRVQVVVDDTSDGEYKSEHSYCVNLESIQFLRTPLQRVAVWRKLCTSSSSRFAQMFVERDLELLVKEHRAWACASITPTAFLLATIVVLCAVIWAAHSNPLLMNTVTEVRQHFQWYSAPQSPISNAWSPHNITNLHRGAK